MSASVDPVADASLRTVRVIEAASERICDVCEQAIEGEPAGSGLFLWTRGEEVRVEEPALCVQCATAIGVTALATWTVEEEEG
jgi:hypothetical protein